MITTAAIAAYRTQLIELIEELESECPNPAPGSPVDELLCAAWETVDIIDVLAWDRTG